MNRRAFVVSGVALAIGTAGCLGDEEEADEGESVTVPTDDELVERYAENSVTASDPISVVGHTGTDVGSGIDVELTLENTDDDSRTVEVDVSAYDGEANLFFVETDSLGNIGPGETVTREYSLNPDEHDGVDDITAYDIEAILLF